MVRLTYSGGNIDREEGRVKDICLPTFTQENKNLLKRLASVQVIQLTNLFKTIFSIKSIDEDDEGPLNWLMSLYVFPQKFVKGHLNASFQSNKLKFAWLYKSMSINLFQYAPQTNQALVMAAQKIWRNSATSSIFKSL